MLGGTDNYEVDRQACEVLEDMMPGSYAMTRNNRRYLERVVHRLLLDPLSERVCARFRPLNIRHSITP